MQLEGVARLLLPQRRVSGLREGSPGSLFFEMGPLGEATGSPVGPVGGEDRVGPDAQARRAEPGR